jgi:hypothetical protein
VAATVHIISMVKTKARKNMMNLFSSDRLAHNFLDGGHAVSDLH